MEKQTFELRNNEEFVALNKILKIKQIAQTGGHAKLLIEDRLVSVNGEIESRIRRKMRKGDLISLEGIEIEIV
ncbi:MAG: RNA-binding S4 domain-containing protein [Crocinitomix sp.]|nr:RNA-binding S4 domain-containing protein [Crocinitomix sp.]